MGLRILVGQFTQMLLVGSGLVVFFAGLLIFAPVLQWLGLSEQAAAAYIGVGTLVGFWVVGLTVLFGPQVLNRADE